MNFKKLKIFSRKNEISNDVSDGSLKIDSDCEKFKAVVEKTITVNFLEILHTKGDDEKFLNYVDTQILNNAIENIFLSALSLCPPQISAACTLSAALLAPSRKEKKNAIMAAHAVAGGSVGIAMVISAIGTSLGWGAGIIASVTTAFAGSSMAGPIGWVLAGISVAGLSGYLSLTSNNQVDTERYVNVLKNSTSKAIDAIWEEHGAALVEYKKKHTTIKESKI